MNYRQALDYVIGQTDYERMAGHTKVVPKFDLHRMEALLERLGDPHKRTPMVHVAGTKGKGSTSAIIASVLKESGYQTGLFSSPHLHTIRERIRLDNKLISEVAFAELVGVVKEAADAVNAAEGLAPISTFEILTAAAFLNSSWSGAQVQVLEVGLGGRLDSTNVVLPMTSVITSLSLDHTDILGSTLTHIAREKAGIIKSGVPVVSAPQADEALVVLEGTARERDASFVLAGRDIRWNQGSVSFKGQSFDVSSQRGEYALWIPLLGAHQLENAAVALGALEQLMKQGFNIPSEAIAEGFRQVSWPGRLEVANESPLVVVDGAHNTYSTNKLVDAVEAIFSYERLFLIVGFSDDKDTSGMVSELAKLGPYVVASKSRHPRASSPEAILAQFRHLGLDGETMPSVSKAMKLALQLVGERDMILATGSLFLVAEAIEDLRGIEPEVYSGLDNPRENKTEKSGI